MIKKTALVTGSTRGIGFGILKELCKSGFFGIMTGRHFDETADRNLQETINNGGQCEFTQLDIADGASRQAAFDSVMKKHGRIDLLVNNAGVAPKIRMDILDTTEENFDGVVNVNQKGTFFMCQAAARYMIQGKQEGFLEYAPRIINISSISSYTSSVMRGEYCISKAGISMITKLFADRLSEFGIPVFEVRPGIIRTDMTAGAAQKYEQLIQDGLTPVKRWGLPEDIANAVCLLCSGKLDFSTGQVLDVDGGFHLRRLN